MVRRASRLLSSLPILAAGGLTVLALAAWTLSIRAEARHQALQEAQQAALRVAQAAARDHERSVEGTLQTLVALSQRPDLRRGDPAVCGDLFGRMVRSVPDYLDLALVSATGAFVCNVRGGSPEFINTDDVSRSVESGNPTLGRYVRDRRSGRPTVPVTAPVVDDSGTARTAIVAALDLTVLGRALTELPLSPGASLALVDATGFVLGHYPDGRWTAEMLGESLRRAVLTAGDTTVAAPDADGVASLFVAVPLLRDVQRAADVAVVIAVPQREVYRDSTRLFTIHLVGLGVIAALVLITAALGIDIVFIRPAHALARALERMSSGEARVRARVPHGADRALRRMAHMIDMLGTRLEGQRHTSRRSTAQGRPVAPPTPAPLVRPETTAARSPEPTTAPGDFEEELRSTDADSVISSPGTEPTVEAHWRLREPPFANAPNPAFLYASPTHETALFRLTYAVRQRRGCALLLGEPGCGKTTLVRALTQRLEPARYDVALLARPLDNPRDLLREMLYELGHPVPERSQPELLHEINTVLTANFKSGRDTVIMLDDVQVVNDRTWFEELSLLLNFQLNEQPLLTMVLVGTPEVGETIATVKHLDRRVAVRCRVEPLSVQHTGGYIAHRLAKAGRTEPIFSPSAIEAIFDLSHGTPREINNVCDAALWLGAREKLDQVGPDLVRRAAAGGDAAAPRAAR